MVTLVVEPIGWVEVARGSVLDATSVLEVEVWEAVVSAEAPSVSELDALSSFRGVNAVVLLAEELVGDVSVVAPVAGVLVGAVVPATTSVPVAVATSWSMLEPG